MKKVGVIIGRFQVAELHEGHKAIIESVQSECYWTCILLGTTSIFSRRNPLNFCQRRSMIKESYQNVDIFPITNHIDDKIWSANIDHLLESLYPGKEIVLYHGRDSFVKCYSGKFKTQYIAIDFPNVSGTSHRDVIQSDYNLSSRKSYINASTLLYPTSYQCVDAVVCNPKTEVLIGFKTLNQQWSFPGGFVDPQDPDLETASARELQEETGILYWPMEYAGSLRINDWRFRDCEHDIMTAVFVRRFGQQDSFKDSDELQQLQFVTYKKAKSLLHEKNNQILEVAWKKISLR